jgi:hypothetical protein
MNFDENEIALFIRTSTNVPTPALINILKNNDTNFFVILKEALIKDIDNDNSTFVKLLIDTGNFDIKSADQNGENYLHDVAHLINEHTDELYELLGTGDYGVNYLTRQINYLYEVADILVKKYGLSPYQKNIHGMRPLDICTNRYFLEDTRENMEGMIALMQGKKTSGYVRPFLPDLRNMLG